VEVYPSSHATVLGAAACAHLALDPQLPVATVGNWTPSAVYEPRWPADRAAEHLERWRTAAQNSLTQKDVR
jgi:glycerol kinase